IPRDWSLGAFLDWEARQAECWELVDGQPVMMAGGTQAHALIAVNLLTTLRPCRGGRRAGWVGPICGFPCRPRGIPATRTSPSTVANSGPTRMTFRCRWWYSTCRIGPKSRRTTTTSPPSGNMSAFPRTNPASACGCAAPMAAWCLKTTSPVSTPRSRWWGSTSRSPWPNSTRAPASHNPIRPGLARAGR
ncbi:MAG: Uma2 family endonuclease, partial [Alphaproteobacteria bacterium]|nr:Uma2 family endonuclease [Alphaproteobacteria bacterium]